MARILILAHLLTHSASAAESFAARAEKTFHDAEQTARKQPNITNLIELARTAFEFAEFARDDDQREELAHQGIDAARRAIDKSPTNAAAHYWLGMDLGQLARTKSLGALKLVREMETEFLRARDLDAHVDYAGPDRSLGYLYRDAPGWPTSVGSKKKAREHFERAAQLHPEFPENQLALAESFEQWADKNSFLRQLKTTEKIFADARAKFTGPAWEQNWADWDKRLARLRSVSGEVGKSLAPKGVK